MPFYAALEIPRRTILSTKKKGGRFPDLPNLLPFRRTSVAY